jgi:hypothetical protein
MEFSIYDTLTGKFFEARLVCSDWLIAEEQKLPPGQAIVNGVFDHKTRYHDLVNTVRFRPNFPCTVDKTTALTDESITISRVPAATIIIVDEQEESAEGEFVFSIDLPGTYVIKLECFPFVPRVYTVTII